jgi:signal transduction histidine kinase
MNNAGNDARAGRSIVFRLSSRMIFRLLGIFVLLDLLLLAAAGAWMIGYAEKTSAELAGLLENEAYYAPEDYSLLGASGFTISRTEGQISGYTVPQQLVFLLPETTAGAARSFAFSSDDPSDAFLEKLDHLEYLVALQIGGSTYLISTDLSRYIRLLNLFFLVLLLVEAVELLKSMSSGARLIRRTLRPLNELARVTEEFNEAGGEPSLEEMQNIASKLDDINASRLDTRIAVDGTQVELKRLATAINALLDRINEAYRAQVRFVSDASHELRTPISVIQGYANLLDRWGKKDEKTLQESISAIKDEAANMKELVEKLLFLARGDNNTLILQLSPVPLDELAEEVLKETEMLDQSHTYTSSLEHLTVSADEGLIKQSLRILVDNAVKYTPSGGHISLSVSKRQGNVLLTVQDDGIGIPSDALPKIFDRFYRADESRARATGGNGLGLSITKWIAERHGGHMEVLSRENLGTRISIVLPASEQPENA